MPRRAFFQRPRISLASGLAGDGDVAVVSAFPFQYPTFYLALPVMLGSSAKLL